MGQGVDANYCDKQGLTLLHLVWLCHSFSFFPFYCFLWKKGGVQWPVPLRELMWNKGQPFYSLIWGWFFMFITRH